MAPRNEMTCQVMTHQRLTYPTSFSVPPKILSKVPQEKSEKETFFTPKGSLDRLLRDSRFLTVMKKLEKIPNLVNWIATSSASKCPECGMTYPVERRIALAMCGHAMCDHCFQVSMGDKTNSVYCSECCEEILVVLIFDRPKNPSSLNNVKHFLLQDDTPIHDKCLQEDPLVYLWRLGKEYPISLPLHDVEPVPAFSDGRKKLSQTLYPMERNIRSLPSQTCLKEDECNRKSLALVEQMLSHIGITVGEISDKTILEEGDIIDWDKAFDEPEVGEEKTQAPPNKSELAYVERVKQVKSLINFESLPNVEIPRNKEPVEDCQSVKSGTNLDSVVLGDDTVEEEHPRSRVLPERIERLISQFPLEYKKPSFTQPPNFITEGRNQKRRLECPQWIMRVQVIPVTLQVQTDNFHQVGQKVGSSLKQRP